MGTSTHFIGRVQSGRAADLFAEGADAPAPGLADGSIVEVREGAITTLADAGTAEAELFKVAAHHKLDPVFPSAVVAQVEQLVSAPGLDDPELEDMSACPFVTIDGASSMDLDQAAFDELAGKGHLVHYALADAAYYVGPGTPLHEEALKRGASYYLPGFMVPMLPRPLSEGLVSLNENVLRRSLVFSMSLDADGRCMGTRVRRALIRSQGKLSFGGVQSFYDGGEGFSPEIDESLRHLAVAGQRRMDLAESHGVVRYRRQSVGTTLGIGGVRFIATTEVRRQVERYNEQLSLLCNTEGARLLEESAGSFVEPIYRAHPPPSEQKMALFEKLVAAIVANHSLEPSKWLWTRQSKGSLSEYLDALPEEGALAHVATAIHRQAIMANVRSTYQTEAANHYGVGAEVYARFSAPMREIVGVFLHRELIQSLAGAGTQNEELRQAVVQKANASKGTQRAITNEANRLVLDQIFEDARAKGASLPGVLMGVQSDKAYVLLDEPPIDAKVYLKGRPHLYRPGPDHASLVPPEGASLRLGDDVSLTVAGHDRDRDRWILDISSR